MRTRMVCTAAVLLLAASFAAVSVAQDFQKTYPAAPGMRISVKNVSGEINVSSNGGASREVLVAAFKEGPDRDCVQIEDSSSAEGISLRVVYPENTRCNAGVRFELKVPQETELNFDSLSTASGDISVQGVKGNVRIRTASGDVAVQQADGSVDASTASGDVSVTGVSGVVSAQTASGDVEVELLHQGRGQEMKFSSASGDVIVHAPSNLDADVRMSTASGDLDTDFPLKVEEPSEGSGRKAAGALGAGSCRLTLSTASGNVKLARTR